MLLFSFGPFIAFADSLVIVLRKVSYIYNLLGSSGDIRFSRFLVSPNYILYKSIDTKDSFFDVRSNISIFRGVDLSYNVKLSYVF